MQLETERLILRPVDPERDLEPWANAHSDEETVRYVGGEVLSPAKAWRMIATVIGHWQIRGYGFFSVERKDTGDWVGHVGPWFPEGWPDQEIGWTISREHWGKGYATEAGRACLDYVFGTLGWDRVIHVILPGNEASIAVARKLGSEFLHTHDGLAGITDETVLIYGQDAPAR
jgi:RimJ/RimL family protein N-acetyltransferase